MKLPFSVADESIKIHHEKMIADGVNPTWDERRALSKTRADQFGLILGEELGRVFGLHGIRDVAEIGKLCSILDGAVPDDGTFDYLEVPISDAIIRARDRYRASLGLGPPMKISKPGALRSIFAGLSRMFKKKEEDAPEFVRLANIPAEYDYVNQCRCRRCGGFYKPVRQGSAHQDYCVDPPDGRPLSPHMHDFWILTCEQCGASRRLTIAVPAQTGITGQLKGL